MSKIYTILLILLYISLLPRVAASASPLLQPGGNILQQAPPNLHLGVFVGKRSKKRAEFIGKRSKNGVEFIGKRSKIRVKFIGKRSFLRKKYYLCSA